METLQRVTLFCLSFNFFGYQRELHCLKQRCSLFRRTTYISSLLERIEVCMVTAPWWIHIQTSPEEQKTIGPTLPEFPSSPQLSFWWSYCEVSSLTAEGRILDYAILLAKTRVDKHVVLITSDAARKVKAMAEGIIWETAPEFLASLLNPLSDRFMWAKCTARGRTWSGTYDEVFQQPSKRKQHSGGAARGLKLIPLHNSLFGKQMTCSKQVNQQPYKVKNCPLQF
ncbi:hypothetical protein MLD38_033690 [Melastoma candidum]|uniref:Uncharacterized protein n=1 Tax=Melastoma candidum TaxID=119954 RepID=A0ACB9M824_9MYRT|nr:hypothetical protein MLD38_033690 [Melastoma candidum]